MPLDQKAVVQELYSRIGSLPPEKAAVVSELAGRFGLSNQGQPTPDEGFIHATLRKTAEKMNLGNVLSTLSEADNLAEQGKIIPNPDKPDEDTAGSKIRELIPNPLDIARDLVHSVVNKDYSGAASTLIPLAAGAAGMSEGAAGVEGEATASTKPSTPPSILPMIQKIASHPDAPAMAKVGLDLALGNHIGAAWGIVKAYLKRQQDTPTPTGKGSTNMPVSTQTSGTVSTGAASSAMGTETPRSGFGFSGTTASSNPFFQAAQTLDHDTQVRLAKAAQNGQMSSIPVEQRGELIKAVQNGDANSINSIMDSVEKAVPDTGQRTPQGNRVDQAVLNKAAIITKFVRDHNIDLSKIADSDRQTIADGAIAHAIKEGHWDKYANKTATYRGGISDASMKIINDAMNLLDGK
jgi:hypothetical protein